MLLLYYYYYYFVLVAGTKITIPQPIPKNIINKIIKLAVGQKDYETLRYMLLEKVCLHRIGNYLMQISLLHLSIFYLF